MKNNKNGFTVIESLVAIICLAVLIGVGFFLVQNHDKQNKTNTNIKNRSASTPERSVSSIKYQGTQVSKYLLSQDNPDAKVNFIVPDGWVATQDSNSNKWYEGWFFADDLTYRPGTKFAYAATASDKKTLRFMLDITDSKDIPYENIDNKKTYLQKTDLGLINGNKAALYYHDFTNDSMDTPLRTQGVEKEYTYFMVKGSDAVEVSYFVFNGDKDQKQFIDQVIDSITF